MNPSNDSKPNGLNQSMLGRHRALRRVRAEHAAEREDHEQGEGEVLHAEQHVLQLLADLDAAVAHVDHRGDEDDAGEGGDPDRVSASSSCPMSSQK